MSHTGQLFLLCLCCACWAFGFGLECPLSSRWMQDAGRSESFIGLNTAVHFAGVILIGLFTPSLIRRAGRACIVVGLALAGTSIALFPEVGPIGWFLSRLLAGAGGALALISLETLINLHSTAERRGRDFACYACAVALGFALGTFVGLHVYAVDPHLSFWLGGTATLAALPLAAWLPAFPHYLEPPVRTARERAPFLSLASAWCQGFIEAGTLALLPLFLRLNGYADGDSGTLLGGILLGVLVFQVPIGWLADRLGRQRALLGCYVIVAGGLAIVPFADRSWGMPLVLAIVGICSGAFYPLGLALMGERLTPDDLPRANAWYLSVNCFGSLISPLVSGPLMEMYGPNAMFWSAEVVILAVLVRVAWRRG